MKSVLKIKTSPNTHPKKSQLLKTEWNNGDKYRHRVIWKVQIISPSIKAAS